MKAKTGQGNTEMQKATGQEQADQPKKTRAGKFLQQYGGSSVADQIRAGNIPGHTASSMPEHRADEPGVIWVDIDLIGDSPFQHEEYIDEAEYQALVESMRKSPYPFALNVNVDSEKPGHYFLTSGGHQRRKAAKEAGRRKMAVFVEPQLSRRELAFRAVRENAVQVNRNRVNMGYLFKQMLEEFADEEEELTQEKIAEEIGMGRSYVEYCILAADKDFPDIQELMIERPDSVKVMLYLRRIRPLIKDPVRKNPTAEEIAEAEQIRRWIAAKYKTGEYSAKDVELEVRNVLEQQRTSRSQENFTVPSEPFVGKGIQSEVGTVSTPFSGEGETGLVAGFPPPLDEDTVNRTEADSADTVKPSPASLVFGEQEKEFRGTPRKGRDSDQITKRRGRAENARGALLSYKKLAPRSREELTREEMALLDDIFCTTLALLDPDLVQYLENRSTMTPGEKPRLVEMLALLLREHGSLAAETDIP
jgi:ParB/RepB/Spo0J family partition protein